LEAVVDIVAAVRARRSIRGFKKDAVPQDVLREILEIAVRAPSANNTQPWEFFVLTGNVLEQARTANLQAFADWTPFTPGIPLPAGKWTEPYRGRQIALGIELFRLLGVGRDDQEGKIAWAEKGLRFFDAPAVILICVDEKDEDIVYIFDCGTVAQTIALVAPAYGLGTCIQRHVTNYPDALRAAAGIPASKRIIIAIPIGYPDPDCPTFHLQTDREPVDAITTWLGFP
jgi:nitroreductase